MVKAQNILIYKESLKDELLICYSSTAVLYTAWQNLRVRPEKPLEIWLKEEQRCNVPEPKTMYSWGGIIQMRLSYS